MVEGFWSQQIHSTQDCKTFTHLCVFDWRQYPTLLYKKSKKHSLSSKQLLHNLSIKTQNPTIFILIFTNTTKMQRLLFFEQLASIFSKKPTNIFTFSNPFTSQPAHAQPPYENVQNTPLSSFLKHPFHSTLSWRSHQQSLAFRTDAFLFNPLLAEQFFASLLTTLLRKSFFDTKVSWTKLRDF